MMAGVQDPPPNTHIRSRCKPPKKGRLSSHPGGGALGKLRQPLLHHPDVLVEVGITVGSRRREQFFDRRFLRADEFSEEGAAALGKKLVGPRMVQIIVFLVRFEIAIHHSIFFFFFFFFFFF